MSKEIIEIKAIAEDLHGNLVRTWENPEQFRNYIERALEQALTAQKEELKKRIEGKRIVVEEKEKGTYYAQHCNGYNQALDDIISELNHQ